MQKIAVVLMVVLGVLAVSGATVEAQMRAQAGQFLDRKAPVISQGLTGIEGVKHPESSGPSLVDMGVDAALTARTVVVCTTAAASKGAGGLAGYAGIASAVSKMGLGSVTTAIAGTMGSSASGAAATAVVTSAVGGPVVMGGILIGGTLLVSYGVFKGGQAVHRWIVK